MGKKIVSLVLSTLITLLLAFPVMASSPNNQSSKILERHVEIKNQKKLVERARNNISDLPIVNQVSKEIINSKGNTSSLYVTKYKTAQLLSREQNTSGDIVSTYAVTTLASYDSSRYDSAWDSTSAIQAYSTVYVSYVNDSHGLAYWKLDHVSGGWGIYSNLITLSNLKVIYGVSGIPIGGGLYQQSLTSNPTTLTFNYSAPTTWKAVLSTGAGIGQPNVGVTTSATLSAFGSTWSLQLSNIYA